MRSYSKYASEKKNVFRQGRVLTGDERSWFSNPLPVDRDGVFFFNIFIYQLSINTCIHNVRIDWNYENGHEMVVAKDIERKKGYCSCCPSSRWLWPSRCQIYHNLISETALNLALNNVVGFEFTGFFRKLRILWWKGESDKIINFYLYLIKTVQYLFSLDKGQARTGPPRYRKYPVGSLFDHLYGTPYISAV